MPRCAVSKPASHPDTAAVAVDESGVTLPNPITRFRRAALVLTVLLTAATVGRAPLSAFQPVTQPALECAPAASIAPPSSLSPALAAVLDRIPKLAEAARQRGNVPGVSVAVVQDQQVIYARGFGCADLGTRTPEAPETILRAGSISKLFTATMLMQLRDAGLLELDRPVRDYVPAVWFRSLDGAEVSPTFRQLASHTSGIPRQMSPPPATPAELFARLHDVTAIAAPGERVSYSNLGVAVLGQTLAVIAGEPYDRYIAEQIFRPLAMLNSSFDPATLPPDLLATGYGDVRISPTGEVIARPVPERTLGPMAPAGGLLTSALDLMRFAALQFRDGPAGGDQVLAGATLREMWQPFASGGGPSSVGIGWFSRQVAGETVIMHNGSVDGFRADLRLAPDLKLGVTVLYNLRPPAGRPFQPPEQLSATILTALIRAAQAGDP